MRLLITGASGELGRTLSERAARQHEVIGTYYSNPSIGGGEAIQLDMCDGSAVQTVIQETQPDAIIHTAVSDQSEDAIAAIPTAARHLSEAAGPIRVIALSTDMVFDGRHSPYEPTDHPTPAIPYGEAKAAMEMYIARNVPNHLIVRTSLIYEFSMASRQVSWMVDTLDRGEPVPLFTDEIRQPIWGPNLADTLIALAAQPNQGIVHVAGPEALSRYDYGLKLLHAMGYTDPPIKPTRAADVAPHRPRDLSLILSASPVPLLTIDEASTAN